MSVLNPNAVPYAPATQVAPVTFQPRRRRNQQRQQRRPGRRFQNRNGNQNRNQSNGQLNKLAASNQQLTQQVTKLTQTVNKVVTANGVLAPQLQTASPAAAPMLLVTPSTQSDVRLSSHPDALNFLYRQLIRVVRSGAGSILGGNGTVTVHVTFPSNQVSHTDGVINLGQGAPDHDV